MTINHKSPLSRKGAETTNHFGLMDGDAFSEMLGMEVIEKSNGYARLELTVKPEMLNGVGVLHGGVIFALADTALAYAFNSYGPPAVTTSVTIHFLRAVRNLGARLVAIAREDNFSGQRGVFDILVTEDDENGRLVSAARGATFQKA